MDLRAWIDREGIGAASRLARDTGLSLPTIYSTRDGRSRPTIETATAISDATDGEVSLQDLGICPHCGAPNASPNGDSKSAARKGKNASDK